MSNEDIKKVSLANLNREERIIQLIRFDHNNQGREEAGYFEHTSDWDPFLLITLHSGEIIESAAGYTNFEIINYRRYRVSSKSKDKLEEIEIYIDNEEFDEPDKKRIKIDDIDEIIWAAH